MNKHRSMPDSHDSTPVRVTNEPHSLQKRISLGESSLECEEKAVQMVMSLPLLVEMDSDLHTSPAMSERERREFEKVSSFNAIHRDKKSEQDNNEYKQAAVLAKDHYSKRHASFDMLAPTGVIF